MLVNQTIPPKQVLVRLPDDVASRLARAVPSRRRNQFLVDLVRRELDKEDDALMAACEAMNTLEKENASMLNETREWLAANLDGSAEEWDPRFDAETFSQEAAIAQAELNSSSTRPGNRA